MKTRNCKHLLLCGCFLATFACSDDLAVDNAQGNLPQLPTEIVTGDRLMWVSYDPEPDKDVNSTTGIHGALVSWRMLPTDPDGTAFDVYKSVTEGSWQKLNTEPIANASCWLDENIDPEKETRYRVTLAGQDDSLCETTFTPQMAQTFFHEIKLDMNLPGVSLQYNADDIQVGELDGDGWPEIVVKREPYDGANQGG